MKEEEMYCLTCGETDKTHSAYCIKCGRSLHGVREKVKDASLEKDGGKRT